MRWQALVAAGIVLSLGIHGGVAAPKRVKTCEPPGGVWGPGNTYRGRLLVYADGTARLFTGTYSEDPKRLKGNEPFPASGGKVKSKNGAFSWTITIKGDGYDVYNDGRYHTHYTCRAG